MTPLPHTPEMLTLAKKFVWFASPEEALDQPRLFLAHAMKYADVKEAEFLRNSLGINTFCEVLDNPPPGIIDKRSWSYWNLLCGRDPLTPLPSRRF